MAAAAAALSLRSSEGSHACTAIGIGYDYLSRPIGVPLHHGPASIVQQQVQVLSSLTPRDLKTFGIHNCYLLY